MFENYLFSKYSKYIVGFAYEIGYGGCSGYIVKTYLVLEKSDKIKVVKYKNYKNMFSTYSKDILISDLQEEGYEPLASLITEKNTKNKKKSLFRVVK